MYYVLMERLYADSGRPCPAVSALQRSKANTGLLGKAVGRSRLAAFLELLLVQVRVRLTCKGRLSLSSIGCRTKLNKCNDNTDNK